MSTPDSAASDANRYRIQRLEQDVHDLQQRIDDFSEVRQIVRGTVRDMDALSKKYDAMQRAFYTAALSLTTAILVATISVLFAIAK